MQDAPVDGNVKFKHNPTLMTVLSHHPQHLRAVPVPIHAIKIIGNVCKLPISTTGQTSAAHKR